MKSVSELIFSGYARCNTCNRLAMTFEMRRLCRDCQRRNLEYGAMHNGQFMSYSELKRRVESGEQFVDGTHAGMRITTKTFELSHVSAKRN